MSRIRSVHPGLWTDESFVTLSPFARLFVMGLWNECDDMGSFAWSPLSLKMKLLPADAVDAVALLNEIAEAGIIMRYEVAGKAFGAVRNFCQYQRPKKANSIYPQTDAVRDWVNISAREKRDGGEGVPNQFPTGGEKVRQMEDGGGRMERSSSDEDVSAEPTDAPLTVDEIVEAWNARMVPKGFPAVRRVTGTRRKHLKARIRENTVEDFQTAMAALERSAFCRGENRDGWRADFDFFVQSKSFTKLLEGAYDH